MTSHTQEDKIVFPGENWFLYWKTSASLWKKKLSEFEIKGKIYVPIYWAYHTENNDQFDFGTYRPETNLGKLVYISKELNKELVFILPFTPAPFFPNGGIPAILAKHFAKHKSGLNFCAINSAGDLNKFFSFFDTRIFQAYSKFVRRLGQYFIDRDISNSIWGFEAFYLQNNSQISYFEDHSVVFDKTFEQYLKSQNKDSEAPGNYNLAKFEFTKIIKDVYKNEAEKFLSSNWEGDLRINFLGGSEKNFYQALNEGSTNTELVSDFIQSIAYKSVPSTILLDSSDSRIEQVSKDLITEQSLYYLMEEKFSPYSENEQFKFKPFSFFSFYEDAYQTNLDSSWENQGVLQLIKSKYGASFCYELDQKFIFDESQENLEKIYFFQAYNITLKNFYEWLKIFMNGANLIVNRNGMPLEILKRLESFVLENKLKVQKLKYETEIQHISLGNGSITLFDSEKISQLSIKSKMKFWQKIIDTYSLKSIEIDRNIDEALDYIWFSRGVGPGELGYEEIRRLYLFNPTSYVKKLQIEIPQYFSLLKIVDQKHTKIETKPKLIKLAMQPGGKVSLDWGIFS